MTTAVQSPATMPERLYRPGLEARADILAELALMWETHQPTPSLAALSARLRMKPTTLRYHLDGLREDGLIHPTVAWLTRAGYELARPR